MRSLAALPLLALAACAVGDPRENGGVVKGPREPQEQKFHVHMATGGARLGAYTVVVTWNPADAVIERITPCTASKFPGSPQFPTGAFLNGRIRIWGLTTDRRHDVPEEYDLLSITFRGLRPVRAQIKVELEAAYDTSRKPQPLPARLNAFPPELDFTLTGP